ncbi:MAG: hypothetical protein ABIO68_01600, partial [Sphingomicrobium sp.]
ATVGADTDPDGAALAYRRLGRLWLRIDLADRLASHARKARSTPGQSPLDGQLAISLGLDERSVALLMAEIGFVKAGDAWQWRGRRGARPERPGGSRPAAGNAFAGLASLKK